MHELFCGENKMDQFENKKYAPIGVFDSGVGGLTVAREIMRQLPQERIIYFGDTARVPYGSKSKETIIRYSRQIIHFLESKGVKAIVVACNTASAFALEELRPEIKMPIIGVVKPGAKVAAELTQNGRIGVIGTEGTVGSHIYTEMIHRHNPHATVQGRACPLFVPLVEEGWLKDPVTIEVARRYLSSFQESDIDTLILGCTHYPLLRSMIREIMGEQVNLVNPAYETAQGLGRLLEQHQLEQHHRIHAGPSLIFTVQRLHNSINPSEIYRPVHLPQQVLLWHEALRVHQLHYPALHFPSLQHFSHPALSYHTNTKKSAFRLTFSTGWPAPEKSRAGFVWLMKNSLSRTSRKCPANFRKIGFYLAGL